MLFSTGLFLFLFLGFTLIYALLKRQLTLRLLFVTAFSYYFYYKSSGFYFGLLAVVTISDYLIARSIHRLGRNDRGKAKALLTLSLLIDLGLLAYFKYTNFFAGMISQMIGSNFQPWDIFLPVGISFFTFQSMSYTIDVFRGKLKPLPSLLDYAFYVSFFPQLVAGPIVRASDFAPQIRKKPCITPKMMAQATWLITIGVFKKCVISDYISMNFVDRIFDNPQLYSGLENLLGIYGYAMQIYCDFSGYSDMAIGIALLLGFKFPMNFNAPYSSRNITDFWRRWHISLSSWIRDYIYISLGGNRKGKVRQYVNLIITMLLGGLWHGASLNFVAWGGMHGVALAFHKFFSQNILHRPRGWESHGLHRIIGTFITFNFVCLAWVFFRNTTFEGSWIMLNQVFTQFHPELWEDIIMGYSIPLLIILWGYVSHFTPSAMTSFCLTALRKGGIILQAIVLVAVIYLVIQVKSSEIQPFIYFQF